MKRPRSGGDDPIRAAVARHEAAKQALPYPIKAALTLYDDGDWEDAALALVDECGLTDRQVKKGRKKLRELGLAVEKKGPHGRLHYRPDWLRLAELLSLDTVAVQTDEVEDWMEDLDALDGAGDSDEWWRTLNRIIMRIKRETEGVA